MNLAIVSTNRAQYSETFIHNHVKFLPATIHYLFGGYLPEKYSVDKGLTAHELRDFKKRRFSLFSFQKKLNGDEILADALAEYLVKNKIKAILCEYGPSGVALLEISKKTRIPLIVHFHGYDAYRSDILNSYGKRYPDLFKHAKAVIGVSSHMCRQLEKSGCDPSKLHKLIYGIDPDIFYRRTSRGEQITFVACGRFVEKKAPQLTIKAFAEVLKKKPGLTLVMIGEGELLQACRSLVEEMGIKQSVSFTGEADQGKIAEIYSRSRIFVQHSITASTNDSEGTPLAILESGACGLPAVSTYHAGIPDVISDGENGFLIPEHDFMAMADKMLFLAEHPELAKRMGQKAADRVSLNHKLGNYTNTLWQIIEGAARST